MSRDVIVGAFYLERLARVEAQVGESQSAIDHLEQLLSSAGGETVSVATLRIDPAWDPLRGLAAFQALLAKYAMARETLGDRSPRLYSWLALLFDDPHFLALEEKVRNSAISGPWGLTP